MVGGGGKTHKSAYDDTGIHTETNKADAEGDIFKMLDNMEEALDHTHQPTSSCGPAAAPNPPPPSRPASCSAGDRVPIKQELAELKSAHEAAMESLGEVQPLLVKFQVMGTDLKRWVAHCETIKFSSELKTALVNMQKKVQRVTSILEHLHVAVDPQRPRGSCSS